MADKKVGWGHCIVKETATQAGTPTSFEDIVEGSTSLSVEEGELQEAKIEGGENEATRRKPDKYTLEFDRRIGSASDVSVGDIDFVDDIYSVEVEPELVGAMCVTLSNCSRHITLSFDSTDGLKAHYTYQTKGKYENGSLTDITISAKAS